MSENRRDRAEWIVLLSNMTEVRCTKDGETPPLLPGEILSAALVATSTLDHGVSALEDIAATLNRIERLLWERLQSS